MLDKSLVLWTIFGVALVYLYMLYASLVRHRNQAESALSAIEIQLRKRYDLIPNMLKLTKRYLEHEKTLLEEVTALRNTAANLSNASTPTDAKKLFDADAMLSNKMGALQIAVENYPDLKGNETVITSMHQYRDIEDNISAARRFYNVAAQDLNNAVEIFPGNLVAPLAKAVKMPYYEDAMKEAIQQAPNASDYL